MITRGYTSLFRAFQAISVLAVGDDVGDVGVGEGVAAGVDEGLQVGARTGD